MRRTMSVDEAFRHAGNPAHVPAEITQAIRDELPHYLWIDNQAEDDVWAWFEGRLPPKSDQRFVYCDYCGGRWEDRRAYSYPYGKHTLCPICQGDVIPRSVRRGCKGTRHRMDVIYYLPSQADPDAVVAYGARVDMDYYGADPDHPWTLEPDITPKALAVIVPGEGAHRFQSFDYGWDNVRRLPEGQHWRPVKRVGELSFGSMFPMQFPERRVLLESLEYALSRSKPLLRAWEDQYLLLDHNQDGVRALDLIARYPCCEYLKKLDMSDLVRARLAGDMPADALYWRGKSMDKVLRMTKQRLGEFKGARIRLTPGAWMVARWADVRGVRCPAKVAFEVGRMATRGCGTVEDMLDRLLKDFQPSRRAKALRYIARVVGRVPGNTVALREFEDYWRECLELGGSLDDDAVAFPADFDAAHDRNRKRMRLISDARKSALIEERLPELQKRFGFRFGGLELRPARDAEEVVREGEVLGHCVARYVDDYAAGHTVICVLRRTVEPDRPWRTVEINNKGQLIQDRGWHNDRGPGTEHMMNDRYQAALALFWSAWRERRKTA